MAKKTLQDVLDEAAEAVAEVVGADVEDIVLSVGFIASTEPDSDADEEPEDDDVEEDDEDVEDDDESDDDEDTEENDAEDDEDGGDEDEEEGEGDGLFTRDELMDTSMSLDDIREAIKEYGKRPVQGKSRAKLADQLVELQSEWCEEEGVPDPNASDDAEDEEGGDEEESDEWTEEELQDKSIGELRAIAKDYGISTRGKKAPALIEEIMNVE